MRKARGTIPRGVCLALAVIPLAPVQASSQASVDSVGLRQIVTRMSSFVDEGRISGAVMLLAHHGQVVLHKSVGYKDLETRDPMRVNTIFQVQSMTKPLTAVAVMMLIEEGRLRLEVPVEDYLPEFRNQTLATGVSIEDRSAPGQERRPITIRDLLKHTSGMQHGHHAYSTAPPTSTLQEVVSSNARQPLMRDPGAEFGYSSLGFETLGRVVETVSQMPYEEFVRVRILDPLGMNDSFFIANPERCGRIAAIYEVTGDTLARFAADPCRPFTYPNPAGGMFSTASDMFAFYQMMLQDGTYNGVRFLSKASVDAMTAPHTPLPPGGPVSAFGLGWWVVDEPAGTVGLPLQSKGAYGHAGYWGTIGWVDPATDLVGVFLVHLHSTAPGRRGTVVREFAEVFVAMAAAAVQD